MKHQTHQKKHVLEISKTRKILVFPLLELNVHELVFMLARAITMAIATAIQLTTRTMWLTGEQHARALEVMIHDWNNVIFTLQRYLSL